MRLRIRIRSSKNLNLLLNKFLKEFPKKKKIDEEKYSSHK